MSPRNPKSWRAGRTLRSDAVIDRFDEVISPTHYTPRSKRITRVGQQIAKDHDPFDAVMAVAQWVRSELDYVPGTTGVHSSGLDALREGKGVCQDFAHLSLIMLRSMGIPARYVSGYLHPTHEAGVGDTIDGQSHAWIQAWTGGWWHYDPTNDSEITEQYVSVGVGRDYSDVAPLKGIYSGEGSTDLDVVVEITRLGLTRPPGAAQIAEARMHVRGEALLLGEYLQQRVEIAALLGVEPGGDPVIVPARQLADAA